MYTRNPELLETDLEHELILLDPATGEMYSLNATGREVWRALPSDSPREIGRRLAAVREVEAEAAERDVCALLAELLRAGLVRRQSL